MKQRTDDLKPAEGVFVALAVSLAMWALLLVGLKACGAL